MVATELTKPHPAYSEGNICLWKTDNPTIFKIIQLDSMADGWSGKYVDWWTYQDSESRTRLLVSEIFLAGCVDPLNVRSVAAALLEALLAQPITFNEWGRLGFTACVEGICRVQCFRPGPNDARSPAIDVYYESEIRNDSERLTGEMWHEAARRLATRLRNS